MDNKCIEEIWMIRAASQPKSPAGREEFMEHITDAEALTQKAKREAVEFPTQLKEAVRAAETRVRGVAAAAGAQVQQVAATAGSETRRAAEAAYQDGRAK
jgi:hypothetical protein